MSPMKDKRWRKSPPELIAAFDQALPRHVAVERRQMFGYPCAFVRGQLFCGLFQDRALVRLGVDGAAAEVATGETEWFSPMAGRPMREYVLVPDAEVENAARFSAWLERGLRYALTLPPKEPKGPKPPKARTATKPAAAAPRATMAAASSKTPRKTATSSAPPPAAAPRKRAR
jgi:TfoX/Sxy family transcriptional regulator of competence genes